MPISPQLSSLRNWLADSSQPLFGSTESFTNFGSDGRYTSADARPLSRSYQGGGDAPNYDTVEGAKATVAARLLELGDRDRSRQARSWFEATSTSFPSAEKHTFASYLGGESSPVSLKGGRGFPNLVVRPIPLRDANAPPRGPKTAGPLLPSVSSLDVFLPPRARRSPPRPQTARPAHFGTQQQQKQQTLRPAAPGQRSASARAPQLHAQETPTRQRQSQRVSARPPSSPPPSPSPLSPAAVWEPSHLSRRSHGGGVDSPGLSLSPGPPLRTASVVSVLSVREQYWGGFGDENGAYGGDGSGLSRADTGRTFRWSIASTPDAHGIAYGAAADGVAAARRPSPPSAQPSPMGLAGRCSTAAPHVRGLSEGSLPPPPLARPSATGSVDSRRGGGPSLLRSRGSGAMVEHVAAVQLARAQAAEKERAEAHVGVALAQAERAAHEQADRHRAAAAKAAAERALAASPFRRRRPAPSALPPKIPVNQPNSAGVVMARIVLEVAHLARAHRVSIATQQRLEAELTAAEVPFDLQAVVGPSAEVRQLAPGSITVQRRRLVVMLLVASPADSSASALRLLGPLLRVSTATGGESDVVHIVNIARGVWELGTGRTVVNAIRFDIPGADRLRVFRHVVLANNLLPSSAAASMAEQLSADLIVVSSEALHTAATAGEEEAQRLDQEKRRKKKEARLKAAERARSGKVGGRARSASPLKIAALVSTGGAAADVRQRRVSVGVRQKRMSRHGADDAVREVQEAAEAAQRALEEHRQHHDALSRREAAKLRAVRGESFAFGLAQVCSRPLLVCKTSAARHAPTADGRSALDTPRTANNFQPAVRVLCNTEARLRASASPLQSHLCDQHADSEPHRPVCSLVPPEIHSGTRRPFLAFPQPGPAGVGLTWFVCHLLRPQQDLVYLARVGHPRAPRPGDGSKSQDHPAGGSGGHYGGKTEAELAHELTMAATQRRLQREAASSELAQVVHVAQKFGHKFFKRVLATHAAKELVVCGEKDSVDIIVVQAERNRLQPEKFVEDVLASASCAVLLYQTGGEDANSMNEKALLRLSPFA